jgi:hypothetical protein
MDVYSCSGPRKGRADASHLTAAGWSISCLLATVVHGGLFPAGRHGCSRLLLPAPSVRVGIVLVGALHSHSTPCTSVTIHMHW